MTDINYHILGDLPDEDAHKDYCEEHGHDNCTQCKLCFRCFTEKQWQNMKGYKDYECNSCYTGPAGY